MAPARTFSAVCEEVGRLLGADITALQTFSGAGTGTVIAAWSDEGPALPVGIQLAVGPGSIGAQILETRAPARRSRSSGEIGEIWIQAQGLESTVGAPMIVDGQVWGALMAGTRRSDPWAEEAQTRLAAFTELVATAIANAESRDALARLADQQAALRRVATLVAEGAPPDALFRAVADEVEAVVGLPTVTLSHHHADGSFTVSRGDEQPRLSRRQPLAAGRARASPRRSTRPVASRASTTTPSSAAPSRRPCTTRRCVRPRDRRSWSTARSGATSPSRRRAQSRCRPGRSSGCSTSPSSSPRQSPTPIRATLARLADEQAALRRVATLVAREAPAGDVFDAVAMEVGKLLDANTTVVGRYDGDGAATAIGSWSTEPGGVPVGTRSTIGGRNVLTLVAETGKPARLDGYGGDASGEAADIARRYGWRSSIAAPIIVDGRLWGVMLVATQRPEPFPGGAEERLAAFTDLVATALANAEAHDAVRRFGEEQAALGRVATLVAGGALPEQVFTAVVDEASTLLGLERIELVRYDGGTTETVMAASGEHPFPAGSAWSLDDPSVMAAVAHTGQAARIDDYSALEGEIARAARSAGFRSGDSVHR